MITMGGFSLPSRTIREMITASVDVVIQVARLRDGTRKITHITEVMGMEGDVIITQDLFVFDMTGEDAQGNILGRHRSTGIGRPRFWDCLLYTSLTNVRVLAIDQNVQEKDGQKVVVGKTATLELTPAQTETLALSQQLGTLSLALRSITDATGDEPQTDDNKHRTGVNVVRFGVSTMTTPK